jgi:hypothetical protein
MVKWPMLLPGLIVIPGKRSVLNYSSTEFYWMLLQSLPKPPGMVPEDQKILPCL